ncbi:HMG-Y-related protein A [Quillaja saponaria]|uniref:HMG-Y-related protein A n=1 Tax=Quillaja saponaria TaxID=32244 RepID=A0AAD7M5E1_QUISA|nr:HMG-Y-related protein A [Quillaja saponaria]
MEMMAIDEDNPHFNKPMRKLLDSIIERARFKLGNPLSVETINQIEARFHQIFPLLGTPDHPPYSQMIYQALNEEGDSSKESISAYIKAKYPDLPWAHETILSHHLGKLRERGEIVTNSINGFFSFPKNEKYPQLQLEYSRNDATGLDNFAAEPLAIVGVAEDNAEVKRRVGRRGRPAKSKRVNDEMGSLQLGQKQTKRRGRPPKKQWKEEMMVEVEADCEQAMRRRGRPRKPRPEPTLQMVVEAQRKRRRQGVIKLEQREC